MRYILTLLMCLSVMSVSAASTVKTVLHSTAVSPGNVSVSWSSTGTAGCTFGKITDPFGNTLAPAGASGGALGLAPGDPGTTYIPQMTISNWGRNNDVAPLTGTANITWASFPAYAGFRVNSSYDMTLRIICKSARNTPVEDTIVVRITNPTAPEIGSYQGKRDAGTWAQYTALQNVNIRLGESIWAQVLSTDESRDIYQTEWSWTRPDGVDSRTSASDNDQMDTLNSVTETYPGMFTSLVVAENKFTPQSPGLYKIYARVKDRTGGTDTTPGHIIINVTCAAAQYYVNGNCTTTRPPTSVPELWTTPASENILNWSCANASNVRLVSRSPSGVTTYLIGSATTFEPIPPFASAGTITVPEQASQSTQDQYELLCGNVIAVDETPNWNSKQYSIPVLTASQTTSPLTPISATLTLRCNRTGDTVMARSYAIYRSFNNGAFGKLTIPAPNQTWSGVAIPNYIDTGVQVGSNVYELVCYDGPFDGSGSPTGTFTGKDQTAPLTFTCPAPWRVDAGQNCIPPNNPASIDIIRGGSGSVYAGNPVYFSSRAEDNDNQADVKEHAIEWQTPDQIANGTYNWSSGSDNDYASVANIDTVGSRSFNPSSISFTVNNGVIVYDTRVAKSSTTQAFTPTTVGTYRIFFKSLDSEGNWVQSNGLTITVVCPPGYLPIPDGSKPCSNPAPVVSVTSGNTSIALGDSLTLGSSFTDTSSDVTEHNLSWKRPSGVWNYVSAADNDEADVTYIGQVSFAASGGKTLSANWKPSNVGVYELRFSARDDSLNDPSIPGYFTPNGRWTGRSITVTVVNGVSARLFEDPTDPSKLKWICLNSTRAKLTKTIASAVTTVFDNPIPPNSGSFSKESGASYSLTCSGAGGTDTFTWVPPIISTNGATQNTVNVQYNCNNPQALSAMITRSPGSVTVIPSNTNGQTTLIGLTPNTDYTVTLRCFNGPVVNGLPSGDAVGTVSTALRTPSTGPTSSIGLEGYIRSANGDPIIWSGTPSNLITTSSDGSFYDWGYRITTGTPSSCTMTQRDDSSAWWAPYATNITDTSMLFSIGYPTPAAKQGFISGFTNTHSWKLVCEEINGAQSEIAWQVKKNSNQPQLVSALCRTTSGPSPTYSIDITCAQADGYAVETPSAAPIASGPYGVSTVSVPISAGTYSVTCKKGATHSVASLRTCNAANFATKFLQLDASPRSIRKDSQTTLTWNAQNPSSSCSLTVVPVRSSADALTEAARIQNILDTTATDANDPNGSRSVTSALTTAVLNANGNQNARGKKTIKNITHSMIFIGSCAVDPQTDPSAVRVRVVVSNENEA